MTEDDAGRVAAEEGGNMTALDPKALESIGIVDTLDGPLNTLLAVRVCGHLVVLDVPRSEPTPATYAEIAAQPRACFCLIQEVA